MVKNNTSGYAIGGGCMLGVGVGFFFLRINIFAFIGCIMAGIGLGLVLESLISKK
jgi:hypothetical protein